MSQRQFKTPRIVQTERRQVWPWLLGGVALAGVAWLAYHQGQQHAGYYANASEAEITALQARIGELREECDQQRELAARYQRAAQIDRAAAEEVRESLRVAQEEQAKLRKQVTFLNSLISGKVTALEVSEVKLARQGNSSEYAFSFLVSKRDKGGERVSGRLELRLSGLLDEKRLDIAQGLKMGFKHFQRFGGKLKLPVGFIPRELVIKGYPDGRKFKPFEKRIKWQV
ncbi:DUF6776 family protein [endosymbiont of unidentified scaly snail isolate Monju]|uniref:DUF6776 family protein n=1 Tax=endosymbiont of unidentified scaly snail isolate Monju TaxID=1248727 RepID=UPI00038923FE|nr:DUF6776 family protein [endosymbiont of unidentified scaly snail isolate Monju]BAN69898.1 hypothetical protein EBS_2039 [endosymbiont of unidentified scaly snail isolate Monju]